MKNLGEIENLVLIGQKPRTNHRMPGSTERMAIYVTPSGHIVELPLAAFNVSPPLKEVPPAKINVLIRVEDE